MSHEPKFFLEGIWKGIGRVVDTIEYEEELEFTRIKPGIYFYQQKTRGEDKELGHTEVGYIRIFKEPNQPEGRIELTVSHPFGVCEISEGTFTENKVVMKASSASRTSSALEGYITK